MEKKPLLTEIPSEESRPSASADDLRARTAEERARLLEHQKLLELRAAAAGRREVEALLEETRAALAEAERRIVELEEERDEIRALLESFLADNWKRLTDETPAMPARLGTLLAGGGSPQEEHVAAPPAGPGGSEVPSSSVAAAAPSKSLDDVEELAAALRTGARFETTESFRRFEPVKTSHIRVSECLASVHDWPSLRNLLQGRVGEQEALEVLFLLLQRSYLRVHTS